MFRCTARLATRAAVLALTAATFSGCAGIKPSAQRPSDTEPGGTVISREEILDSGARTAMEVIERANTHLVIARTRAGDPARITHRGVDSFLIPPDILLVVDGSRVMYSSQALDDIPARSIRFIQILSGREAVMRWGSESGNGVIVVQTSAF